MVLWVVPTISWISIDRYNCIINISSLSIVYATTAANAQESSYACYLDKKRMTYLGDVYSVKWMEDSDKVGKGVLHSRFFLYELFLYLSVFKKVYQYTINPATNVGFRYI